MRLIKVENYELKVADEALLVKPIRRLFNMDRSQGKEQFYKQMSMLFFCYDPSSNYSYITDEKDRIKEIMAQEGISNFKPSAEFKAAVDVYKKLTKTTSSELLTDVKLAIEKVRQALNSVDFSDMEEKDKVNALKTVTSVISMVPKLVKDLTEAEKAIAKELTEQTNARGSQELTVGDMLLD